MMYNFPFYPHFAPRKYYHYSQPFNKPLRPEPSASHSNYCPKPSSITATSCSEEKDDFILDILGIKLHSDDILLICLIFFLFKEGVQDEYLFVALILLLLS